MPHAQGINGPGDLRKDAFPQGVPVQSEHNGVAVARGVLHNAVDDLKGAKTTFSASTTTRQVNKLMIAARNIIMQLVIHPSNMRFNV